MKVLNFNDPYVDSKGDVNNLGDVLSDTSVDLTDYAKKTDIPATLPANGGNADTVNNHTVESDVPENSVFTDTIYDDAEVKESINELNSNLDVLQYGDTHGGKNLLDFYTVTSTIGNVFEDKPIYLKAGTYTASSVVTPTDLSCVAVFYGSDKTTEVGRCGFNGTDNTFTLTSDAHYWRLYFPGSGTISNMQIEKGSQATPYEPYIPSVKMLADDLGGLSLSVSGTILTITNGENTWTLNANS